MTRLRREPALIIAAIAAAAVAAGEVLGVPPAVLAAIPVIAGMITRTQVWSNDRVGAELLDAEMGLSDPSYPTR